MEVADNSNFEVTVCKYDITQTIQREKKKLPPATGVIPRRRIVTTIVIL
jgi:hypothetical protein